VFAPLLFLFKIGHEACPCRATHAMLTEKIHGILSHHTRSLAGVFFTLTLIFGAKAIF